MLDQGVSWASCPIRAREGGACAGTCTRPVSLRGAIKRKYRMEKMGGEASGEELRVVRSQGGTVLRFFFLKGKGIPRGDLDGKSSGWEAVMGSASCWLVTIP